MAFLYRLSIRYPKTAIAVAVLITAAVAPGIMRLHIRTDGHALVPTDASEIRTDQRIREQFGVEDPIVVLISADQPGGVFKSGYAVAHQRSDDSHPESRRG